jgi:hypothetical protein
MLIVMNNGSDKLRDYIGQNSSSFNDLKAPKGLWEQIEPQLDPDKGPGNALKWIMVALGVFMLVMAAYYWGNTSRKKQTVPTEVQQVLDVQTEALEYADIPDFLETQQYYDMKIYQVYDELLATDPDNELIQDINQLDVIQDELLADLKEAEGVYKERVLHAMIQNQQTKLNLLMDVLDQIKTSEEEKNRYELF